MATSSVKNDDERRKQVMVGYLPNDFLRITPTNQQQQLAADEQAAVALQQQLTGGFAPPNISGRLTISVIEARLNKNYGVTRMDPYVRLRLGHIVYETPTDYNGAKNPKWNKVFHCLLQTGMNTLTVELYDECAFTLDERIAWAQYQIPDIIFKGETVEEWIQLNGKLGDQKEGTVNIVFSYMAFPNGQVQQPPMVVLQSTPPCYGVLPVMPYYAPAAMYPVGQYAPQPWAGHPQTPQQPPPQQPRPPVTITENDIKQVREMFPTMDQEVIKTVLESHRGNKDMAINALLQMNSDN